MYACTERDHRPTWRVVVRKANHSAFNGGRRTASPYSQVRCGTCGAVWRTKAAYVDELPGDRTASPEAAREAASGGSSGGRV